MEVTQDKEKNEFYNKLDKVFDKCPRHDVKIILGNFNAKIWKEDILKPTIGKYSLQNEANEKGRMLINYAAFKDLVIGSIYRGKKYGTLFI